METYFDDITVQQGEDFNMDILVSASNLEYIPFLVTSQRPNPHFVVTVASTKYEKNMRYVDSWWNDPVKQAQLPLFWQTTPFIADSLYNLSSKPSESQLTSANPDESKEHRYLYRYTLSSDSFDEELGHKPYHYAYIDYGSGSNVVHYDDYECRIRQNFSSLITRQWGAQNYMYQITLVTGRKAKEVIRALFDEYGEKYIDFPIPRDENDKPLEATDEWPQEYLNKCYEYIKKQWPSYLSPDIDWDSPLYTIDVPEVVIAPHKLTVDNNLRQII